IAELSSDETWTVAELSSFQLETVESLRANVAVITNITPDHLDRHGSLENYARAKQRIFMSQSESDWAVLNGQDPVTDSLSDLLGTRARKVYFSSRGRDLRSGGRADIYVRDGRVYTSMVSDGGGEVEVIPTDEITLRGMHNVENVMASLAATFCAMSTREGGLEALRACIRRFKGVEHRIEFVTEIEGVRFYNDSKATNVDSTVKALEAFDRNVVVILGGKDKGSDYRMLAPLVRERVKQVVLIGAASDKIAAHLEGSSPMTRAGSMEDAVLKSFEAAVAGDTVLLAPACASFDMFDNYEQRGRVFKEAVFKLASRIHSGWTGRLTT
ncbi:MAG TPA: UDP-N-acetylmuramoyl-L-alanine--D-glutamate ligase, partial [Blastocatellia bacterium]|nr:UDP-N-acetylmuramoyl-L-alanine--D-glutamate ligase [Blastocatellia bacterium]